MPLKTSTGNMYPWVTHTHCHLGGECPHECSYCYVDTPRWGRPERYQGQLRLIEKEFRVNYDEKTLTRNGGKHPSTIFMENCNDLFAEIVDDNAIKYVLNHCKAWPENTYVFQTKNPARYQEFLSMLPLKCILGATIETNRDIPEELSKAPRPIDRFEAMAELTEYDKFVTIEPIMDLDPHVLSSWISWIDPEFVNIGADSKKHNLPEPNKETIERLIALLGDIEIREKHNLDRLMKTT